MQHRYLKAFQGQRSGNPSLAHQQVALSWKSKGFEILLVFVCPLVEVIDKSYTEEKIRTDSGKSSTSENGRSHAFGTRKASSKVSCVAVRAINHPSCL